MGGLFQRVQVKTGHKASHNTLACSYFNRAGTPYGITSIDLLAVVDLPTQKVYLIPAKDITPGNKTVCVNLGNRKMKNSRFKGEDHIL
jgi:hypothetical protein